MARSAVGGWRSYRIDHRGPSRNAVIEIAALSLAAAGIWGTPGPFWALSTES